MLNMQVVDSGFFPSVFESVTISISNLAIVNTTMSSLEVESVK